MNAIKVKVLNEKQVIDSVVKIILEHIPLDVEEVFLFGSRAKRQNRAFSDFDIGIRALSPIPPYIIQKIEDDINRLDTLKSVDIVDFLSVSEELAEEAYKSKRILYARKTHYTARKSLQPA